MSLVNMAKRRDEAASRSPLPWKLQDEYWSVYPLASLAVHGASQGLFWNIQLHQPTLGSGQRYPYLIPSRARAWAAALARYDSVQSWEALNFLTTPSIQEAVSLVALYDSASHGDT